MKSDCKHFSNGQLVALIGCINGLGDDRAILQIGYCDINSIDSNTRIVPQDVIDEYNHEFESRVGANVKCMNVGELHMIHRLIIDDMNTKRGFPVVDKIYRLPELRDALCKAR